MSLQLLFSCLTQLLQLEFSTETHKTQHVRTGWSLGKHCHLLKSCQEDIPVLLGGC